METKNPNTIIHISGPSGAGKSTLGNKLKDKFLDKICVKDIDVLRYEFIVEHYGDKKWTIFDKVAYQKFIDNFVTKHKKQPIVFVGLNNMPWYHKDLYYDMHSEYNFFIEIDDNTVLKQKATRFLNHMPNLLKDKLVLNDLLNNNEKFLKIIKGGIDNELNKKTLIKNNKKWHNDYTKQNYTFLERNEIYKQCCKILSKVV